MLFKDDLKSAVVDLRRELAGVEEKLRKFKTDLVKWMFIFWIGQIAVTFGFILLFLNN